MSALKKAARDREWRWAAACVLLAIVATTQVVSAESVRVGGGSGGSGISQAAADARYLMLDASNDPLTSSLGITQDTAGTVGMVVTNYNADAAARTRLDLYSENATMWQECRPAAATGTFQDATNANICLIGTEEASSLAIGTFDAAPIYLGTNDTLAMTVEADQDVLVSSGLGVASKSTVTPPQPTVNTPLYVEGSEAGNVGAYIYNNSADSAATATVTASTAETSVALYANDDGHATWPGRAELRANSDATGLNIAAAAANGDIRFIANAGGALDTSDEKARINADGTTCWGATSCTETMSITGTLSATGNATFNGNVVLGSDTADAVTLNADLITVGSDTVVDISTPGTDGWTFSGGDVAVTTSGNNAILKVRSTSASGDESIYFYDNSNVLKGRMGYANASFAEADIRNVYVLAYDSVKTIFLQEDDIAAGTIGWQWGDAISGVATALMTLDGAGNLALAAGATRSKGTITLSGGTGTATVASGAVCVCTDTTAANAVKCAVSSTTLTATGTTTDVIAYHCL